MFAAAAEPFSLAVETSVVLRRVYFLMAKLLLTLK